MILTRIFNEFFYSEKAGGLILVFATVLSLGLANSPWGESYIDVWQTDIAGHHIVYWINEGMMALFFLLIGLELEREIYHGELSDIKNATLPIFGAIGGMVVPAGIFLMFNAGTDFQRGAGIPMATDIAFAIGILSLLGNRVPVSLKIFLTALAVIDDLGAILIIAFFYTTTLAFTNLLIALAIFTVLIVLSRMKVNNLVVYLAGGLLMWYFMSLSGIHPTITGVLVAFVIPFRDGKEESPSYVLQNFLNKPVGLFILPLFALANTAFVIGDNWYSGLAQAGSLGIMAGLLIGKPLGIWLFSFIGVRLRLCSLPPDLKWSNIIGAGVLGGIGFTMSIFITLLAFENQEMIDYSKIAILIASLLAGIIGYFWLKLSIGSSNGTSVE